MMPGSTIVFYLLAAFTLGSAVIAVTARRIFRAAISLLFSLVGVAGIYFWMNYQFVGAVQIVVYVGGIVVLIIFSILLTQQSGEKLPKQKWNRSLFAGLATLCGFALTLVQIFQQSFTGSAEAPVDVSVKNIGLELLSLDKNGYALPFEVVSLLLLAAMIACIVIAMRGPGERRETETERGRGKGTAAITMEEAALIVHEETGGIE
jgi:NADH-quinone oxidoreductase subunit J